MGAVAGGGAGKFLLKTVTTTDCNVGPLFALPLCDTKVDMSSMLFCHCTLTVIMLNVVVGVRGRSFTVGGTSILPLYVVKLLFSFSSLFLFVDCGCVSTNVTSAVLFICPMLMTVVVTMMFGRGMSPIAVFSVTLTFIKVSLLYGDPKKRALDLIKVAFIFLSSLSCTVCVINMGHSSLGSVPVTGLAFCILLFNLSICIIQLGFYAKLRPVPAPLL